MGIPGDSEQLLDTLGLLYQKTCHFVKCNTDKRALTPNWQDDSPSYAELEANPEKHGLDSWEAIGIVAGLSHAVIIDLDEHKEGVSGRESLAKFCKSNGHSIEELESLSWLIVQTPSGGLHLYFDDPNIEWSPAAGVLPGVDIRGGNSYAICPPTETPVGRYKVIKSDPSRHNPPPEWLQSLRSRQKHPTKGLKAADLLSIEASLKSIDPDKKRKIERVLDIIARAPQGRRNDTLNSVVFSKIAPLVAGSSDEITWIIPRILEAGIAAGLSKKETEATIRSAFQGYFATATTARDILSKIDLTADGIADYFKRRMGELIVFSPGLGWGYYEAEINTYQFNINSEYKALEALKFVRYEIALMGSKLPDDDDIKALKRRALSIRDRSIEPIMRMIKVTCNVRMEDFDRDPYKINMKNGVLDLLTGKLIPFDECHEKFRYNTKTVWDPAITKKPGWALWDKILHGAVRMADGKFSQEDAYKLQIFLGHSLVAHKEAAFEYRGSYNLLEIIGPQASGKSTILEGVRQAMGDYAVAVEPEAFAKQRAGSDTRAQLFQAIGSRIILVNEGHAGLTLDSALIKRMSDSALQIRTLYKEPIETYLLSKILFVGNSFAKLDAQDYAVQRRIELISFDYSLREDERDESLFTRVQHDPEVASAVFYWMYLGWKEIQEKGIDMPHTRRGEELRKEQLEDSSPVVDWLRSEATFDPEYKIKYKVSELHDMYATWLKEKNYGTKAFSTAQSFSRTLFAIAKSFGWDIRRVKSHGDRFVYGLAISPKESSIAKPAWMK